MDTSYVNCGKCGNRFPVSPSFRGNKPKCSSCRKHKQPVVPDQQAILNAAFRQARWAAEAEGVSVLLFLEKKYPFPEQSEVPDAIPKRLHSEWVYSLDRSWGRAFRAVLLLLIYVGIDNQVEEYDIMAGKGFFDNKFHELRREFGFFEK